jgi:hypothetical protein
LKFLNNSNIWFYFERKLFIHIKIFILFTQSEGGLIMNIKRLWSVILIVSISFLAMPLTSCRRNAQTTTDSRRQKRLPARRVSQRPVSSGPRNVGGFRRGNKWDQQITGDEKMEEDNAQ